MDNAPTTPPSTGDLDPDDGLHAVVALRQLADRLEDEHVERAISQGWWWARIAEALNVTRRAIHKKHSPRLRPLLRYDSNHGFRRVPERPVNDNNDNNDIRHTPAEFRRTRLEAVLNSDRK